MKRLLTLALPLGAIILSVYAATAQGPQREFRSQPAPGGERPGGRRGDGPPPFGPPPRWQLGNLIPPHIQDQLDLSEDQEKQLRDLEQEVRDRVRKMLTSAQKKKLESLQRRGPGGPPPRGRGEPPDREGPPGKGRPPAPPKDREDDR
jgi:Spy/CpxP family protein refolding chaperone